MEFELPGAKEVEDLKNYSNAMNTLRVLMGCSTTSDSELIIALAKKLDQQTQMNKALKAARLMDMTILRAVLLDNGGTVNVSSKVMEANEEPFQGVYIVKDQEFPYYVLTLVPDVATFSEIINRHDFPKSVRQYPPCAVCQDPLFPGSEDPSDPTIHTVCRPKE